MTLDNKEYSNSKYKIVLPLIEVFEYEEYVTLLLIPICYCLLVCSWTCWSTLTALLSLNTSTIICTVVAFSAKESRDTLLRAYSSLCRVDYISASQRTRRTTSCIDFILTASGIDSSGITFLDSNTRTINFICPSNISRLTEAISYTLWRTASTLRWIQKVQTCCWTCRTTCPIFGMNASATSRVYIS